MEPIIYADHAATTPLSPLAWQAMQPWLRDRFANPAALYRSGQEARRAVEQARRQVAGCLGCAPHQIFFTSAAVKATPGLFTAALRARAPAAGRW